MHRRPRAAALARALLAAQLGLATPASAEPHIAAGDWPSYGRDPGGTRYAPLADVNRDNVARLEVAWVARTGDVVEGRPPHRTTSAFQVTPLLVDETLFACTPTNRVLALDPVTGQERWAFDPGLDRTVAYANQFVCRGVATWVDPARGPAEPCRRRIFTATNDARLLALDAATGLPCADFGADGSVDLREGVGEIRWLGEYQVTSAPAVAGDVVVVGSAVSDNARIDAPSGVVRGFDARSGALRWAFDPVPPGVAPGGRAPGTGFALSSPNVWGPISVDEARDLVFLPTGNPTPDYASGHRAGLDHFGSSVVALRGSTGALVWHFQTVHHDVWDYDVPAQPTLVTLRREGGDVPAVVQATKMGLLFTLHRESGIPIFPVEERPVPGGGESGFVLSPTQPFPTKPPPLVRQALSADDAWGFTFLDRRACRRWIAALRSDGIYTPPSRQGSLVVPGNAGGVNWGGVAFHPERQILVTNVTELPFVVTLIPRERFSAEKAANPGVEMAPQEGTAFGLRREPLLSPLGVPCSPPPWGSLVAVDMGEGEILWQVPLGTIRDLAPLPIPWRSGTPSSGGPLVTAGGLVFIGAAMDDYLRAFDLESGEELWKGRLPAGGQATPMTYRAAGRQFVLIAAGGHGKAGTRLGDSLVAFAL
ncbi:MAG TPA: pyrroloquinoline quinone-dependent dehydrogenase, partial [Longimicrobiales bacterium]|nr:pyrroloquinoline quinone-dependent dehydrogenase [Longimicrobiales bacterium]